MEICPVSPTCLGGAELLALGTVELEASEASKTATSPTLNHPEGSLLMSSVWLQPLQDLTDSLKLCDTGHVPRLTKPPLFRRYWIARGSYFLRTWWLISETTDWSQICRCCLLSQACLPWFPFWAALGCHLPQSTAQSWPDSRPGLWPSKQLPAQRDQPPVSLSHTTQSNMHHNSICHSYPLTWALTSKSSLSTTAWLPLSCMYL